MSAEVIDFQEKRKEKFREFLKKLNDECLSQEEVQYHLNKNKKYVLDFADSVIPNTPYIGMITVIIDDYYYFLMMDKVND